MNSPFSALAAFRPNRSDHSNAAILATVILGGGRRATTTSVLRFALKMAAERVEPMLPDVARFGGAAVIPAIRPTMVQILNRMGPPSRSGK